MKNFTASNGAVFVGQTVQPANIEEIKGAWWYLAPRNGHVSTYSDFTFFVIDKKLGLLYRRNYRLGGNFVFTGWVIESPTLRNSHWPGFRP